MSLHQLAAGNESNTPEAQRAMQNATLHGHWLLLARCICVAVFGFSLTVFFAGLPEYFAQLHIVCASSACTLWQLTPTSVLALQQVGLTVESYAIYSVALSITSVFVWSTVGAIIAWRKSNDWMALLVSILLVTTGVAGQSLPDLNHHTTALVASSSPWFVPAMVVCFLATFLFLLVFLLFPDGRFVPHWTRWLLVVGIALLGGAAILFISPAPFSPWLYLLFLVGFVGTDALGLFAQLYRYRYVSTSMQRQQTKWVVLGIMVGLLVTVGGLLPTLLFPSLYHPGLYVLTVKPVGILLLLFAPLSFGIAILRYRLWDIDLIINRTLVYSVLTVSIIALYILVVVGLGTVLQAQGNLAISLLATGLIAVLFHPLRSRLQRAVNRLMYGERDDPYAVLSRLGQRLEATLAPEAVLPTIVETVAQALKLPYAAITLKQEQHFALAASYGSPAETVQRLPLTYQQELVGELVLAPRGHGEGFSPADRRLLDDLARQAGVAAHAVRLTADLQRSRERLVSTREEERRRLRRDLHDGLGPTLAALNLQAGVVRTLLKSDPVAADELVTEWRTELRAAIADIRRLVYELRPPALDELGLVGAIRERAAQYGVHAETNGLQVGIEAPDELLPMPAAVEVAVYRIAQEALANVVRHAQARTCCIRLWVDEALHLEISDDGRGLPVEHHVGVGLLSMRERAAELGGTCVIEPNVTGGTCVLARLPLPQDAG